MSAISRRDVLTTAASAGAVALSAGAASAAVALSVGEGDAAERHVEHFKGMLARLEQMVATLDDRYINAHWPGIDRDMAERALAYARGHVARGYHPSEDLEDSDPEGFDAYLDFIREHGQDLHWAITGDYAERALIAIGAEHSPRTLKASGIAIGCATCGSPRRPTCDDCGVPA